MWQVSLVDDSATRSQPQIAVSGQITRSSGMRDALINPRTQLTNTMRLIALVLHPADVALVMILP